MKHAMRSAVLAALLLMLAACSAADDAVTGNGGTDVNEQNGGSKKGGGDEGADGAGAGPDGAESTEGAFYEVLATNLRSPWSIAFDGEVFYISERDGAIVRVAGGKIEREEVKLAKPVHQEGESGFLGLELAPDFRDSGRAYAYHTYNENGRLLNRIVVLERKDGVWTEKEALLEGIPGAVLHDGGRLKLGPDGYLYITTGDATEEELAQNTDSLAGKILRMTQDGDVPGDNPFTGSYVYTYGHRNPQGIGWDTKGAMFSMEHGPSSSPRGYDELNRIRPGLNYGWPDVFGDETKEGTEPPVYHTGDTAFAPSGMAIDEEGNIIAAGLAGSRLIKLSPNGVVLDTLLENEGRLRDVFIYKGSLYVITNNTDGRGEPGDADDRLLKLTVK